MNGASEIIIYQTADGLSKIDVRMEGDSLWLTQAQMAQLFGRERSVITKHIQNIFAEGELDEKSNVQNLHIPNSDKPVVFYALDMILAVGYRVKSPREHDNPSIGILLCKERDKLTAEYALRDIHKPIGVSEYKLSDFVPEEFADTLPSAEDIEKRIREKYDIEDMRQ